MYVTCIYNIYNNTDKILEYVRLFIPLAYSGLNIHLYTTSDLSHHFINYPKTVKVFVVPLKYLEFYNLGINENAELPNERNHDKDTREYLSLMNCKVEFLKRSSEICQDDNLIWIDFAILKLFNNLLQAFNYFKQIENTMFAKVNIPGCWYKGEALYLDSIHWRFCGSLLIVPRRWMQRFYNDCKSTYINFILVHEKILTWEVNVWNHIEYYKGHDYIKWYYALHDDTMLINLFENINPRTGKKI